MLAVSVFSILSLLLVCGKVLRVNLSFLQRLYLPSSVIGGLVGLAAISVFRDKVPPEWVACAQKFPGFLINVIFATLFLGVATPRFGTVVRIAFPQLCFGQLLAWGQYVLGLGLAGFVLVPLFGVPPAFGNLLEIGFQGGHGTVGGMSESFRSFGWEDGIDLGLTVATVGMIVGVVVGMALVGWAYGRGYVKEVLSFDERPELERRGIHPPDARPAAGRQTVCSDSIDSLAWHIAIVGLAVGIGYLLLLGLQHAEVALFPNATRRLFTGFPLFPLCMIGGVLLQSAVTRCGGSLLVDHGQMQRLSGAALDFLVLSAVATIKLSVVAANWAPLLALCLCGTLLSLLLVVFLAPRLFREAWFERAIAEFGQSTGVTATGLLLLRTVDPESKTVAAASFGYKQLLHEPFMGGGLWTALALTLVYQFGWKPVWYFSVAMAAAWSVAAYLVIRANRRKAGHK
ncbi:MAG: sodium:glutamate symporter [Kiritimatiellae bacterium]|nr:sodium:glutamate symporter [Kiritimatiellia bacterium]